MGKNYWMVVESPEKFEVFRRRGLTLYALGSNYRRRAERMQPDDRVLFYVSKIRKWAATATIASPSFEDRTPLFSPVTRGELYPHRVKITPDIILPQHHYIDAGLIAPRLEYLKRWVPEDWPLAFFDGLHLLPQRDFRLIEGEMKRLRPGRRGRSGRNRRNRRPRSAAPTNEMPQNGQDERSDAQN